MTALLRRRRQILDLGACLMKTQNTAEANLLHSTSSILKDHANNFSDKTFDSRVFSTAQQSGLHTPESTVNPPESDANVAAKSSSSFSDVPIVPKLLGLGGLIPFIALSPPIANLIPGLPIEIVSNAAFLQIGYGATIASFLGGIHWATAMTNYGSASLVANNIRYLWSVTPCVLAWPALILQPGPASVSLILLLQAVYSVDFTFARKGLLPPWYMALRLPLTMTASLGLLVTCVSSFI